METNNESNLFNLINSSTNIKTSSNQKFNLLNYLNVTTNKALILSNSLNNSPTNSSSTNQQNRIMNAITVEKLKITDLEEKLNSEIDLNNLLDLIEINKSLPFTKNQETLDDYERNDDKFQIKIRIKDDLNFKIASIQLLSSEEMFELHCGETNEYLNTVNCSFIDKLDQQFVIYYGCHNLIQTSSKTLRNESFLKKSLNITFPKFNSNGNDTIWIFAIKLNLIESRLNLQSNNTFNSINNMLPLIQLFNQLKSNNRNDLDLKNNLSINLMKSLPDNLQNLFNKNELITENNLINNHQIEDNQIKDNQIKKVPICKKLIVNKRIKNKRTNNLIIKKLNCLENRIDLIDKKLDDLKLALIKN